jgi:hypothetical protein
MRNVQEKILSIKEAKTMTALMSWWPKERLFSDIPGKGVCLRNKNLVIKNNHVYPPPSSESQGVMSDFGIIDASHLS